MHKQQHEKHKPAAQVRLSRTPLWKHMCGNRQAAANTQPEINKIKAKGEQKKPLRCQSYPRIRTHTHTHKYTDTHRHRHRHTQTQTHTDTDTNLALLANGEEAAMQTRCNRRGKQESSSIKTNNIVKLGTALGDNSRHAVQNNLKGNGIPQCRENCTITSQHNGKK